MAQVPAPPLASPGRYRLVVLAREHDWHKQADALGRKDLAPLREKLLERFANRSDVAVEIVQSTRVDLAPLFTESNVPIDLIRERVPGKADDGHTVIAHAQHVGPLLPEPVDGLSTASLPSWPWSKLVSVCITGRP
jgi:hypothetical protein